jgi:hypothetical protein
LAEKKKVTGFAAKMPVGIIPTGLKRTILFAMEIYALLPMITTCFVANIEINGAIPGKKNSVGDGFERIIPPLHNLAAFRNCVIPCFREIRKIPDWKSAGELVARFPDARCANPRPGKPVWTIENNEKTEPCCVLKNKARCFAGAGHCFVRRITPIGIRDKIIRYSSQIPG